MAENDHVDPVYKYIDGKVNSLKGGITRLKTRIENLEILGLQDQINSIDSQVKKIDSILLSLERDVARLRISHDLHWALWVLQPMPQTSDVANCIRYARESAASAAGLIHTSSTPHEVADDWYSRCKDYFLKHGNFEIFA